MGADGANCWSVLVNAMVMQINAAEDEVRQGGSAVYKITVDAVFGLH